MNRTLNLGAALLLAAVSPLRHPASTPSDAQPSLHIVDQWKLAGAAGWGPLCFDAANRLLYIPRTDRITVLDGDTGQVRGEIAGFVDARNVALDNAGKYGYATDIMDGATGYVRVFDRGSFKLITSIPVGRIPGAVVFDPTTRSVFAFSSRDRNAAVIDSASNALVATIPLPGKPHLAVTDGKGSVYVSFRGIGKLIRLDAAARKPVADWSTAPCDEFHGMTIDVAHGQLLASCYNQQLVALDAQTGALTPIGQCALDSSDLTFDPRRKVLLNATSRGVLTVFGQQTATAYKRQEDVIAPPRSGTIAVDPDRGRVYFVTAEFGQRPVSGKGLEEMQSRLAPIPGSFRVIVAAR